MTAIEWTDETLNVVTGCDIVSPGCKHCYAKDLAPRLRAMGNPKYQDVRDGEPPTSGPAFGVTLHPAELEKPFHWRKPRKVFVCSMGDLFHEEVPQPFIDRVFAVMALTPHITYQVLTKRPDRMREHLTRVPRPAYGRRQSLAASPAVRIGHQVSHIVDERGRPVICSTFVPSDDQRRRIADGENIELIIWSTAQPPVALRLDDTPLGKSPEAADRE